MAQSATKIARGAGSRLTGAQRGEHAERTRGVTLARQPFVHLRATDPTGRQHHAEIGHVLDEEALSASCGSLHGPADQASGFQFTSAFSEITKYAAPIA